MNLSLNGLSDLAVSLINDSRQANALLQTMQGGYRPRQWPIAGVEELVYCKTNIGGLFFDAVFSTTTSHSATITSHPVQNGANISDHMYDNPVSISMEIGMSDAMATMVSGQFCSAYTKSVSAYRELVKLMQAHQPITVLTRMNQYPNMVIQGITVEDGPNTLTGLRANVNMQQIIMASVATEKVSARNWTSASSAKRGEAQPKETPTSVMRQGEIAAGMN